MFDKLNPTEICRAHLNTMRNFATGKISRAEQALHLVAPAILSFTYIGFFSVPDKDVVSIVVSAASIVAGLLLNLLVLIYTLAFNARSRKAHVANYARLHMLMHECLATIAYAVLLCLALICSSFLCLSDNECLAQVGTWLTTYSGASVLMCLLIVLKRCYVIISVELTER